MLLSLDEKLHALLRDFPALWPETALAGLFVLLVVIDLVFRRRAAGLTGWVTLAGLAAVLGMMVWRFLFLGNESGPYLLGLLHRSSLIAFFQCLFTITALLAVLFSWAERQPYRRNGEFAVLLVSAVLGMYLMVGTTHLLMLYLSVELLSISSYILTYLAANRKSAAASVRYILFGAMSSGVMLYGMSWLYGLTGLLDFAADGFWTALAAQPDAVKAALLVLLAGGLLFKVAAVPFHVWAPEVYDAAPLAVTAFFSVAPKVAGLLVLFTLSRYAAPHWTGFQTFVAVVAVASITVGNFGALVQRNARRLLAYSSVAQAGFMLIPVAVGGSFAVQGFMFYAIVYLCMNTGAFLLLHALEAATGSDQIGDFAGLGTQRPWLGVGMVAAMAALAGLPPTAGFTAKLLVFSALWQAYGQSGDPLLLALFVWGLFNVAVALFYYLRIPYFMFFKPAVQEPTVVFHWPEAVLAALVLLPVLVLFFKPFLPSLNF
ncbi:MAG: NADH-quinone oxidoreductase subunit N [Cytophagales bacterium]|nr:NADH-quinone oxidoreductase subunit N [Cytophagales bacterium]